MSACISEVCCRVPVWYRQDGAVRHTLAPSIRNSTGPPDRMTAKLLSFIVIFPRRRCPVHHEGAMPRILLVEDNEMNRDMLSRRLQRKGYEIVLALDGVQGVEMARTQSPDLILMDMSLPVLDGWEATKQLKSDEATRGIPVIALTAHAMAGDEQKALAAGCDDYDTKPVELQRLLGKIEALLARKAKS